METESLTLNLQYEVARTAAVVFDISYRDEITLTGNDRQSFLHGFCTNEIKKLQPGSGCEAFIPSIKGKTLGHVFVFNEHEHLIIDTVAGANETLLPHLDRYLIVEDVQLQATQTERALWYLTGPQAEVFVEKLCQKALSLKLMQSSVCEIRGVSGTVRRVDWLAQPGYQLRFPVAQAETVWQAIQELGIPKGEPALWEILRVAALFPQFGVDFHADNLAQEIDRTAQAISFHKGCYLGQEPIARIDALGHVNRLLRGLKITGWQGSIESLVGAEIISPEQDSKVIGQISSAVEVPAAEGKPAEQLAIGLVRREFAEPMQKVVIRRDTQQGTGEIYWR